MEKFSDPSFVRENRDRNSGGPSRRTLLSIGWAGSLVALSGPGLVNFRYLFPNVLYGPPAIFKLKGPAEYGKDSFTFHDAHRLFVTNDRNGFRAMSAICTHLRCTIAPFGPPTKEYNVVHSRCPCHGSVFDSDGNVLKGPAPRPLDFFGLTLSPDKRLRVDMREIVAPDERLKV